MASVDLAKLRELEAQGYLTGRQHPTLELLIWNYTPKAQFEKHWTPETLACRGLITDLAGRIIARPFEKFFNLEERQEPIPIEPFEVYEKMDGSLFIVAWWGGHLVTATRGSFISEQAVKGAEILMWKTRGHPEDAIAPNFTYLFEVLYPENRIVVDYGDREDIVLLAVIQTHTGLEVNLDEVVGYHNPLPFSKVKRYDGIRDISEVRSLRHEKHENQEGFVVRFTESNLRLKIKLDEYVRLHKILTGIHARHIWEYLSQGKSFDELLNRVPDEFYQWVNATRRDLLILFKQIEDDSALMAVKALRFKTRKEQAEFVRMFENNHIIFKMLDGKPYDEAIWKLIKPAAERPFRQDEEA